MLGRENDDSWSELQEQLSRIDEVLLCAVEKNLFGWSDGRSALENLAALHSQDRPYAGNQQENYNTYPFGAPTDTVYPRLLVSCCGETTLRSTLKAIAVRSKKMAGLFPSDERKTVFLLTDKWSSDAFRDYELTFLNHAIRNNIWYVFLLVTDYGITQIPFLPEDRDFFRRYDIQSVEENVSIERLLDLLHDAPMTYHFSAGPLDKNSETEYLFDSDRMVWSRHSLTEGLCERRINQSTFIRFLKTAEWLAEDSIQLVEKGEPVFCDDGRGTLDIFDWHLDLARSYTDQSGSYSDEQVELLMKKLRRELSRLIDQCEKQVCR